MQVGVAVAPPQTGKMLQCAAYAAGGEAVEVAGGDFGNAFRIAADGARRDVAENIAGLAG